MGGALVVGLLGCALCWLGEHALPRVGTVCCRCSLGLQSGRGRGVGGGGGGGQSLGGGLCQLWFTVAHWVLADGFRDRLMNEAAAVLRLLQG